MEEDMGHQWAHMDPTDTAGWAMAGWDTQEWGTELGCLA